MEASGRCSLRALRYRVAANDVLIEGRAVAYDGGRGNVLVGAVGYDGSCGERRAAALNSLVTVILNYRHGDCVCIAFIRVADAAPYQPTWRAWQFVSMLTVLRRKLAIGLRCSLDNPEARTAKTY
jgi:hypothetical protein